MNGAARLLETLRESRPRCHSVIDAMTGENKTAHRKSGPLAELTLGRAVDAARLFPAP